MKNNNYILLDVYLIIYFELNNETMFKEFREIKEYYS